ncbi:hypothetical protein CAPTEDRAFT_110971 [Capitella teleta]|uniref:Copper homeostasis protein cutC homolog n=1 Tax=Capitella teleta TaxID=283909 RepID=R7V2Q3_CAPTE|nr:hypothetical protein CAPTEDRAFT_110971 [Capitella teleta]|eukprot:ELU10606.1 hypothetical protein CAPTEDRAFT_110971 [Capitella teleta]
MIPIEICVHSKDDFYVFSSVSKAWEGGADRIELCSHMEQDGLTPSVRHIELARDAFKNRSGLLVMVRPIGGDFFYTPDEIALMEQQIKDAAKAGADGVVIGVLDEKTSAVHRTYSERLIGKAREYDLTVTFHRAFDATPDWQYSLETLLDLGVDRVLTSGIAWGVGGTAEDGIKQLVNIGAFVSGGLEIVVGGGVSLENAPRIIEVLNTELTRFSLHTFSSVLENGNVSSAKVQQLKSLVAPN